MSQLDRASTATNADPVETVLQLAIDLHGPALLRQPDKLQRHLEQQCPDETSDIAFLLIALEEEVPQTLLSMSSPDEMQVVGPRLEQRLAEKRGLNPFATRWTVATWASALRMDLAGSADDANARRPSRSAAPLHADPTQSPAKTAPDVASVPFSILSSKSAAGVSVSRPIEVERPVTVPVAKTEPPAEPTTKPSEPIPIAPHEPLPTSIAAAEPLPPLGVEAPVAIAVASATPDPIVVASEATEPIVAAPEAAHAIVVEAEAPPAVVVVDPPSPPPVAEQPIPRWAAPAPVPRAAPVRNGFSHWYGVAGVGIAIVIAIGAFRFMAGRTSIEPQPTSVPVAEQAVAPPPVPVPPPPIASAPAPVEVVSDGPVIGDGKAPAPVRPPAIVTVIAPAAIVTGKPFTLTIGYRDSDAGLASIERKVVERHAAVGPKTTAISTLATPARGALRYPFEAIDKASRSTLEFTLIDRDGIRSEPKRFVVEAVAPTTEGPMVACSRDNCGSIVAVREIPGSGEGADRSAAKPSTKAAPRRAKTYEVIVRTDDRNIHTLQLQGTWKVGAHVRLAGSRLVAADTRGSSRASSQPLPQGRLLPESAPIIEQ